MVSRLRRAFGRISPKAITEWNHKRIGAVSLFVVLAIVVGALLLTSNVFSSTYPVNAEFQNAVGLNPGAEVLMAGVQVGKVSNVAVVGNHVQATLAIDDGVQIPADSSADISVETLLGVIGVNIQPGGDWQHLLRSGSTVSNTAVPFEFFQIRNSAGHLLQATNAQALGQVVSGLSRATSGDKRQIRELIDGLANLTTTVDAHSVQASQLISAAKDLSAVLASKDRQLGTVVDDLDSVVKGLSSNSRQLGTLISATEQAASQTSSLIGRNQPRLQQMLTDLHTALQVVGSHQLDLARGVAFAASAIRGFSSIAQSGSAEPPWANIYANIVGSSVAIGVLGNCGALDQALDVALGPDPRACSARSGPLPNNGNGLGSAGSVGSSGTPSPPATPSPGPGSGGSGSASATSASVSALFTPLVPARGGAR